LWLIHAKVCSTNQRWASDIGRFTMRNRYRGGLKSTDMLNEKVMTACADQGRRPAEGGLDFPL
jgi:hypothetical protein